MFVLFLQGNLSLASPKILFCGIHRFTISICDVASQFKGIAKRRFTHLSPTITCSKLTIETLEQGVKYVQS